MAKGKILLLVEKDASILMPGGESYRIYWTCVLLAATPDRALGIAAERAHDSALWNLDRVLAGYEYPPT